jgi:hypothetical protein
MDWFATAGTALPRRTSSRRTWIKLTQSRAVPAPAAARSRSLRRVEGLRFGTGPSAAWMAAVPVVIDAGPSALNKLYIP